MKALETVEREYILECLKTFGGNRTHTARAISVPIRTLRNKLNRYRAQGFEIEQPLIGVSVANKPIQLVEQVGGSKLVFSSITDAAQFLGSYAAKINQCLSTGQLFDCGGHQYKVTQGKLIAPVQKDTTGLEQYEPTE